MSTRYTPYFPHSLLHAALWLEAVACFYVAMAMVGKPLHIEGAPDWASHPLVIGSVVAAFTVPFIALISLIGGVAFFSSEYWVEEGGKIELSFLPSIALAAYPIAFLMTQNTSMGVYVVGALLIMLLFALLAIGFKPLRSGPPAVRGGLFWSGVVGSVVAGLAACYAALSGVAPMELLNPLRTLDYTMPLTTLLGAWALSEFSKDALIIPTLLFIAFVVGFAEEVVGRVSIPYVAAAAGMPVAYGAMLTNTVFISLHAVPVVAFLAENGTLGLLPIVVNVIALTVISLFLMYIFGATGDYVTTAIAHAMYDILVSLGTWGAVAGALLAALNYRYRWFK